MYVYYPPPSSHFPFPHPFSVSVSFSFPFPHPLFRISDPSHPIPSLASTQTIRIRIRILIPIYSPHGAPESETVSSPLFPVSHVSPFSRGSFLAWYQLSLYIRSAHRDTHPHPHLSTLELLFYHSYWVL
ncbi:hypothetical protein M422DRAFT_33697 [Sphaerobolus stellatus SS14]|uniref:Uncharacterized protein n=1 Tax=Sphaerobolus stellatus (strain SS14) TaxID=990650 RepID=A0A0C9VJ44_SPHS4|nr:hypothetical protein M422DRAFT_33697 [Sphaerobolus stellatus SS14]